MASKKRKYWYRFYHWECPVCWSHGYDKIRVYDEPKPEKIEDRHIFDEIYDWCAG